MDESTLSLLLIVVTIVVVFGIGLAKLKRRQQRSEAPQVAPPVVANAGGSNDCKICLLAPAYHRPSFIAEHRGQLDWMRTADGRREAFAPAMYRREIDQESPPAYCDNCVLDIDAMTDAEIADRRRTQAALQRANTKTNSDFMKTRDDKARKQMRGGGSVVQLAPSGTG